MNMSDSAMVKLRDTFVHVQFAGSLDECLCELSSMAGSVLNAKGCAIALLSEREVDEIGLRPGAGFGELPKIRVEGEANDRRGWHGEHPDSSGDLPSEFNTTGVRIKRPIRDKMFSTIVLNGKIIGVIHAYRLRQHGGFTKHDLNLFSILTLLITKSIQVVQLQNLLNSRFAQMALTRSGDKTISEIVSGSAQNPNNIARILAKSFYREMTNAGFNFNQIIYAASEVISELSSSLRKHSAGRKRPVENEGLNPSGKRRNPELS